MTVDEATSSCLRVSAILLQAVGHADMAGMVRSLLLRHGFGRLAVGLESKSGPRVGT